MKTRWNSTATLVASLGLLVVMAGARAAQALPLQEQQAGQPKYSRAEYDAYQATAAEKNLQQKVKLLDDFMAKYPTSDLLVYIYSEYVETYSALRQWPKVIEYFDRLLSLSKLEDVVRLNTLYHRAATFELAYNPKDPNAQEVSIKARDAAVQGLKLLQVLKKPEQATDEQWAAARKQYATQLSNTAGLASIYLKDFKAATENLRSSLAVDQQQPVTYYRMGLAYLQQDPPQSMDGFWAFARAVNLKMPDSPKITKFLSDKIFEYQQPGCKTSVVAETKELLSLAANSPDRPAGFTIPSAADLAKVREQTDIITVLANLKAGGEKGKLTWLVVCNGEFPEAIAKAYEVNAATDSVTIKAAVGPSEDEVNASAAPNSDLKISGQPEAARLEKDKAFTFSGKLTGYTPDPFFMTWENVKVKADDIPAQKTKPEAKHPTKHPAKRPPSSNP
jgi:tetratricopeptide (TPR) repeat protein